MLLLILGIALSRLISPVVPSAKLIVSIPPAASASVMAWRREPGPESARVVTVNVPPLRSIRRSSGSARIGILDGGKMELQSILETRQRRDDLDDFLACLNMSPF